MFIHNYECTRNWKQVTQSDSESLHKHLDAYIRIKTDKSPVHGFQFGALVTVLPFILLPNIHHSNYFSVKSAVHIILARKQR